MKTLEPAALQKETARVAVIPQVVRFTREEWPQQNNNVDVAKCQKLADSLSTLHGCLLYGTRVVIPSKLFLRVLQLLHKGLFGIQSTKQLFRTAVCWPNIVDLCRFCTACAEHQNRLSKSLIDSYSRWHQKSHGVQ